MLEHIGSVSCRMWKVKICCAVGTNKLTSNGLYKNLHELCGNGTGGLGQNKLLLLIIETCMWLQSEAACFGLKAFVH